MGEPAPAGDFELLPAIDLRGGRVVRLVEGDFARETAYSDDPAAVAVAFAADGARWLHVVDLDGARTGTPVHSDVIEDVVAAVAGPVGIEVAGGIRTAETAREVLARGAMRIVVGTAALRDPAFAAALVSEHGPERVVAAIDVRDGRARGDGWARDAPGTDAATAVARLADAGVTTFEVTAIDRDGLLGGPDLDLLERLVRLARGRVIASGGVSSIGDLRAALAIGCSGAIVGRALYEGGLTVRAALAAIDAARVSGD